MLSELAKKGLQIGFFKTCSSTHPLTCNYGPLTSNLFFYFRHEWMKSFIRNSFGRYNFLWLDSIDQIESSEHLTIAWQTKRSNDISKPPLILKKENQNEDDYLCVRYYRPHKEIHLNYLSNERTRFWKKYISHREKLQCISSKSNQFNIQYRFSVDSEPYHLETIETNSDNSSIDLILNVNQTLSSLLIDSQMKYLHPLLSIHQIAIESTSKTNELSFYLSKLLTCQYQLRVLRLIDQQQAYDYIPFYLILNDESVKNGVCLVRNRDANLKEQIHVKQVAKYFSEYFQSLEDVV